MLRLSAVILAAGVAAIFLPCLFNGFVYDDAIYVVDNPAIREFSPAGLKTLWTNFFCSSYVPLTMTSFAVDYRLFGLNPAAFHATNIVLHAINAVLVLFLAFRLGGSAAAAVVTAVLFSVHPLRVEAVAWVSARKDLLSAAFFLAGLLSYLEWRKTGASGWYQASLGTGVLSLLAKPAAVSFPLALLCLDYFHGRKPDRDTLIRLIPFFAVAGLGTVITLVSQRDVIPSVTPLWMGIFLPAAGLVLYLHKTLVPVNLSCLYPIPPFDLLAAQFPGNIAILAACAAAVLLTTRRTRTVAFGCLFFLATILPSLKVVPFSVNLAGDRYTYLPSTGLSFIAAALCARFLRDRRQTVRFATLACLASTVAVLTSLTVARCRVWRNEVTLWNDAVTAAPHPVTYACRAIAYSWAGDFDRAIADFTTSISLDPACSKTLVDRADTYARMGKVQESVADYTRAIQVESALRADMQSLYRAYQNRASVYCQMGRKEEALADYGQALRIFPDEPVTLSDKGVLLMSMGRYREALADFNRLIQIYPDRGDIYYRRATCHYALGDIRSATADAREAVNRGFAPPEKFLEKLRLR